MVRGNIALFTYLNHSCRVGIFFYRYWLLFNNQKSKDLGQQQLLLVILGIIIVGIAIAVSIQLFRTSAIDGKRDIMINECSNIASIAISYYKKPKEMGGGGKTFLGWSVPNQLVNTVNGSYIADVQGDQVTITGTGTEIVTGNDSIKIQTIVTANEIFSIIIN